MGFTHDPKVDLLSRVALFDGLPERALRTIASRLDVVDVDAGSTIISEGARGLEFFVVAEGYAAVERAGRMIGRVGPGEIVGEMAVLEHDNRNATVTAKSAMRLLVGERRQLMPLLEEHPAVHQRVQAALDARHGSAA